MSVIIDPTNENVAFVDGLLGNAVRMGALSNPEAPTMRDLETMPIVGYTTQRFKMGN